MQIKKLILSVLAILLVLWQTGTFVHAETTYTEGDFYYTIADESITITGYFGKEKEVVLPDMIAGYPVNTIASGAFQNTSVETLFLPDTITSIEENAIDMNVSVVYNYNVVDPSVPAGSSEKVVQQTTSVDGVETVEVVFEEEEIAVESTEKIETIAESKKSNNRLALCIAALAVCGASVAGILITATRRNKR